MQQLYRRQGRANIPPPNAGEAAGRNEAGDYGVQVAERGPRELAELNRLPPREARLVCDGAAAGGGERAELTAGSTPHRNAATQSSEPALRLPARAVALPAVPVVRNQPPVEIALRAFLPGIAGAPRRGYRSGARSSTMVGTNSETVGWMCIARCNSVNGALAYEIEKSVDHFVATHSQERCAKYKFALRVNEDFHEALRLPLFEGAADLFHGHSKWWSQLPRHPHLRARSAGEPTR